MDEHEFVEVDGWDGSKRVVNRARMSDTGKRMLDHAIADGWARAVERAEMEAELAAHHRAAQAEAARREIRQSFPDDAEIRALELGAKTAVRLYELEPNGHNSIAALHAEKVLLLTGEIRRLRQALHTIAIAYPDSGAGHAAQNALDGRPAL